MEQESKPKKYRLDDTDLDHWAKIERESKRKHVVGACGEKIEGAILRVQALEWLRIESIRLAYKSCSKASLRALGEQDHDIKHALGTARDCLIQLPPSVVDWCYPYFWERIKKASYFEVLKPKETEPNQASMEALSSAHRQGRVVISIDPHHNKHVLDSLRKYLKKNGARAPGAGRRPSLVKLRRALLKYETWLRAKPIKTHKDHAPYIFYPKAFKDNATMRRIGDELLSSDSRYNTNDNREKRAQKTIQLACMMIEVAALQPTYIWPAKFR